MHKALIAFGASAAFVCLSSLAQAATVNLTEISGAPPPGEVAVNLTSATNSQTSSGLAGTTTVLFSSTQFLDFANGNATVSIHGSGTFSNLTIGVLTGSTFTDLDFNVLFPTGLSGNVTVTGDNGATQVGTATLMNIGPGLKDLLFTSSSALTCCDYVWNNRGFAAQTVCTFRTPLGCSVARHIRAVGYFPGWPRRFWLAQEAKGAGGRLAFVR